eukprot:Transcript_20639.p1 GENE.Transcript_20639~~Transcript_20639.p1  ORF type:complete len:295 (-),score=82.19 Transcript_20639:332-1216(-)
MLACCALALANLPSLKDVEAARGALVPLRGKDLHFELFVPKAWQPAVPSPVLVFLHGRGESGGFDVTNAQSLPWQLVSGNNASFASSCGFIVVVPQCPQTCASLNHWMTPTLQNVAALVHDWVVPTLGGDAHRVYLAGQSMGGHGAWIFAAQQPRLFAAVVVVCGYAQGEQEQSTIAERLVRQGLGVHVYHSADDSVIPVAASDQMAEAIRRQGKHPERLAYTRYETAPGPPMPEFAHLTGHGSYELAFRDPGLWSWLLRHECSRCTRPLAPWKPLGNYAEAGGDDGGLAGLLG